MRKGTSIVMGSITIIVLIGILVFLAQKGDEAPSSATMENTEASEAANSLVITTVSEGTGAEAKAGDTVFVHYTGTLEDGTKFDSSVDRGVPFSFTLGAGQVISGWEEGILGMKIGEKRRLSVPSSMAYGEGGIPGVIPGGATLLFDVELLAIEQ